MDDALIAGEDQPIARKSVIPGTGFFLPDDLEEGIEEARTKAALADAEAAVIADPDADGLACVALIREVYDDLRDVPEPPESDSEDDAETDPAKPSPTVAPDSTLELDPLDDPDAVPHRVALLPASPHDFETMIGRVAEYADPGIDWNRHGTDGH